MRLVWQTFAESLTWGRVLPRLEKGEEVPLAFQAAPTARRMGDGHPRDSLDCTPAWPAAFSKNTAKAQAKQEASVLE